MLLLGVTIMQGYLNEIFGEPNWDYVWSPSPIVGAFLVMIKGKKLDLLKGKSDGSTV
jgi:hypothetical protein